MTINFQHEENKLAKSITEVSPHHPGIAYIIPKAIEAVKSTSNRDRLFILVLAAILALGM